MPFDIYYSAISLFNRLNVKKQADNSAEVLDSSEISKAKQWGFNLFEITENMKENDFIDKYFEVAPFDDDTVGMKQFEQKVNDIHVKYLQIQYNTSEEIKEGETIEEYEQRIILNDELSRLTQEDNAVYEDAINNSDSYEKLLDANRYFYNKYGDDYNAVLTKLLDLQHNVISEEYDFAQTLPQKEQDILNQIMSGRCFSKKVSESKNIINEAKEIVNKYPDNIKKDGFIQNKIKEYENYLSPYNEYIDFFVELENNKTPDNIQLAFKTIINGEYKYASVIDAKETINTAKENIKNYPQYAELIQSKINEAIQFLNVM